MLTLNIGLASILSSLLFATLSKPTDYAEHNTLQLQGLKAFMKDVEMPHLKEMMQETPGYYYELLPYAYAFGTATQWTKKFDLLSVTPPTWYQDNRTEPAKTPRNILATLTTLLKQHFVSEAAKPAKKEDAAQTAPLPDALPSNTPSTSDSAFTDNLVSTDATPHANETPIELIAHTDEEVSPENVNALDEASGEKEHFE